MDTPAFLLHHSADEIHAKMKEELPADLDMSSGGHAWNLTRVTAMAVAELYEMILPEVINVIFPETSYGDFLDGHAKSRTIVRLPATYATGEVTITGEPESVIPAGSLFSTAAVNDEPSVDYETLEAVTIPESGSAKAAVLCTQAGTIGNTIAGTVVLVSSKLTGVNAVINEAAITGGTEEESDEALSERVLEYDRNADGSYTGNPGDYKRWAREVPGVGDATVISAQDDTGLVTIILTDANGDPATAALCKAVYDHIMRPDDAYSRLAPVNAYLIVTPPATIAISISATVELEEGAALEGVKAAFLAAVARYLPQALEEGEVKYTRVAATLAAVEGANDFRDLKIGTGTALGTANIPITTNQLPTVSADECVLTSGVVE